VKGWAKSFTREIAAVAWCWEKALTDPTAAMVELDSVLVALEQENQTND